MRALLPRLATTAPALALSTAAATPAPRRRRVASVDLLEITHRRHLGAQTRSLELRSASRHDHFRESSIRSCPRTKGNRGPPVDGAEHLLNESEPVRALLALQLAKQKMVCAISGAVPLLFELNTVRVLALVLVVFNRAWAAAQDDEEPAGIRWVAFCVANLVQERMAAGVVAHLALHEILDGVVRRVHLPANAWMNTVPKLHVVRPRNQHHKDAESLDAEAPAVDQLRVLERVFEEPRLAVPDGKRIVLDAVHVQERGHRLEDGDLVEAGCGGGLQIGEDVGEMRDRLLRRLLQFEDVRHDAGAKAKELAHRVGDDLSRNPRADDLRSPVRFGQVVLHKVADVLRHRFGDGRRLGLASLRRRRRLLCGWNFDDPIIEVVRGGGGGGRVHDPLLFVRGNGLGSASEGWWVGALAWRPPHVSRRLPASRPRWGSFLRGSRRFRALLVALCHLVVAFLSWSFLWRNIAVC